MRLGYGDAGNSGADHHLPLIACVFYTFRAIGNVFEALSIEANRSSTIAVRREP